MRGRQGKVRNSIYPSTYLHAGEPMFFSQPIKGCEKWDTDPASGMIYREPEAGIRRRFASVQCNYPTATTFGAPVDLPL
jgi:hypothetical protein